jgi:hypothetical protein
MGRSAEKTTGNGRVQQRFCYRRNEMGAVTVFIVIMFAFLLTFSGLVFDVGRIFNIYSQAQSYVDAVAVTAAVELDGQSGAIQRAIRAAVGDAQHGALLGSGSRLSLSGDKNVNVQSLVFIESLAADPVPGTRSPVAGDVVLCTYASGSLSCAGGVTQAIADRRAHYMLVTATTETENFILFPIAAALIPDIKKQASVAPQALAGFTSSLCNFTPLSVCNPYESQTAPYGGSYIPIVGQQILLKMQGSGAQWGPGDFGLLQPDAGAGGPACSGSGGANFMRCVLATSSPNTQCIPSSDTVDMEPGQKTGPVQDGFNVRFDIYKSPLNSNDLNFPPSANVTKGRLIKCPTAQLSNTPVASKTIPLPRDSCFKSADTCTGTVNCNGGRFGNGVKKSQLQTYWTTNHGGTLPAGLQTRYDVYRYEMDHNLIPNKSGLSPKGENGNPTCSGSAPVTSAVLDRRVLTVAVINCLQNNIKGSTKDVPVVAFARMFMTEPVGLCVSDDLYAEMLSLTAPSTGGGGGVLRQHPVLSR